MEDINRRQVLKSIGTVGVTLGSATTVVSADNYSGPNEAAEEALNDSKVESIVDSMKNLKFGKTRIKEVEVSGTKIKGTWIETNIGTLLHAEGDSGETEAVLDLDDLSEDPSLRRHLPKKYRQVPKESEIRIRGHKSSVSLLRMATEAEERDIQDALPEKVEVQSAAYDSELDAFLVSTGDDENDEINYRVKPTGGKRAVPSDEVESIVTIQSCGVSCAACASAVVAKGLCYYSCYQTAGLTCVICIANTNVALPIACDRCFDQCGIQA